MVKSKFKSGPVVLVSQPVKYAIPLGYAYLAGYLLEKGVSVKILFKPHDSSQIGQLVNQIMQLDPVLVGFGSLYPELFEISQIIQMLNRAGRKFPIVIGGQMVSPIPQLALDVTGADFGVMDEGEITLYRLVEALQENHDPLTIPGIVAKQENAFITTGKGEFIEDLSLLPKIPYELFPVHEWLEVGKHVREEDQPHCLPTDRTITVHGSRGCPFTCNFCYHHSRPRYRPLNLAIGEAGEALERFDGNMLFISDDTTINSAKRAKELVDEIKKLNRPVEYTVSTRFDILEKIDDNLLLSMKESGCRIISLGAESGSERILKIIGKNSSVDGMLNGLDRLKKAGILPIVFMMVGQYTETINDVEASIEFVRKTVCNDKNILYACSIATPFPGTQLYDLIFEKGFLSSDREFYDLFFKNGKNLSPFQTVVNLTEMKNDEIVSMFKKIQYVYREEKKRT